MGDKQVAHFDGTNWDQVLVPGGRTGEQLIDVWAAAVDDVWAAGDEGTVWHDDGTGFQVVPSAPKQRVDALHGAASDDVWIFGVERAPLIGSVVEHVGAAGVVERIFTLERPIQMQIVNGLPLAVDRRGAVWERSEGANEELSAAWLVDENQGFGIGFFGAQVLPTARGAYCHSETACRCRRSRE